MVQLQACFGSYNMLSLVQGLLGMSAGASVGFTLGLVGGGGSILAVPLLLYVVGVKDAHTAIGTSAVGVALNAAVNLALHARTKNVVWRCGVVFTATGIVGAFVGSKLGQLVDGQHLLVLFALLMIVVGILMLRKREIEGAETVLFDKMTIAKIAGAGLVAGSISGFFGIGGGFLIVPGLVMSTGMPLILAIGTSLLSVTSFGITTALSYASSGFVDWPVASVFVMGGIIGSIAGTKLARKLATKRGQLNRIFAALIFAVSAYMLARSL